MTTCKEHLAAALDGMYSADVFGTAGAYNGSSVNAIVKVGESPDIDRPRNAAVETMTMRVRRTDVASPAYGDTWITDGEADPWSMKRVMAARVDGWLLYFERNRRHVP